MPALVKLRSPTNSRPQDFAAVSIAELKQTIAHVVTRVQREAAVAITRHGKVSAVVLSPETYESLVERAGDPLAKLSAHYDQMLASMQTPEAKAAVGGLFPALPEARKAVG